MVVRFDAGGAALMRESDGLTDEDLRVVRRKIGPARLLQPVRNSDSSHSHIKLVIVNFVQTNINIHTRKPSTAHQYIKQEGISRPHNS